MLRSLLIKASGIAKQGNISDIAARYNPYIINSIKQKLAAGNLLENALRAAQQTTYGKDVVEWPILDSARVRVRPQDFINPKILLRIPASTGGTTGTSLKLWRSLENIAAEQMFLDELLAPYGFSFRTSRIAILRGSNIKSPEDHAPPFGKLSHSGKRLTLSSLHLSPYTLEWFTNALDEFNPDIVWVYPNTALNLLQLCEQKNIQLKIPVILSSSETLSPILHARLETYFSSMVINYYGQAERVCLAYSTKPNEFYFYPRYGKVELSPLPDGTAKIIATGFWNSAMPLIRYDTGDLITLPKDCTPHILSQIAKGECAFPGILGRDNEYLLTREGIRITGLNQVSRECNNILQLQFVQEDFENVTINVVTTTAFNKADETHIIEQTRLKLPDSIKLKLSVVSKPTLQKNGKAQLVIRNFAL